MTKPFNPDNTLLHDIWQPWAKKYGYCGVGDRLVNSREAEDLLEDCTSKTCSFSLRLRTMSSHGYAIPNELALNAITELSPIIEIGSGSGYWAQLLRKKGADVIAVDDKSDGLREYFIEDTVFIDGVQFVNSNEGFRDRTLLLCWPRDAHDMLKVFKGDHVVIVGEPPGGCTWAISEDDEDFAVWELVDLIDVPTWPTIVDELRIYKRNSVAALEE